MESSLLAVHLTVAGIEQVMIFTRSNWKWFCKQVLVLPQPLQSFHWLRKHQLSLLLQDGSLEVTEFNFTYHSSMSNFNHSGEQESAYTAVVDGTNINLTPLGKFVMPPPLFEKQVSLPSFATCLSM